MAVPSESGANLGCKEEMPCQIDLPAVTYQYLTFLQSLSEWCRHMILHTGLLWRIVPPTPQTFHLLQRKKSCSKDVFTEQGLHFAAYVEHLDPNGLHVHAKAYKNS